MSHFTKMLRSPSMPPTHTRIDLFSADTSSK
jgi:hypothetical protein